jgi:hypothetical protein
VSLATPAFFLRGHQPEADAGWLARDLHFEERRRKQSNGSAASGTLKTTTVFESVRAG